jgi:hypothetical protein
MLLPKVQQYTLENTEGTINNGESRETGNITRRRQAKQNHNTICVVHHYTQSTSET